MSKRISVFLALLLLAALVLSPVPACAEDESGEDSMIHIRTADDLLALADACSLDTWSDGKKIVLDNDLSLSGAAFCSIPIFNGEFDGGGHTIYDMELSSAQSPCGFILETGKDAVVQSLHVNGSVSAAGDDCLVGGLVGLNRGLLTNSGFSGNVDAFGQVGGLVGKNDPTGIITGCSAEGSVFGLSQVGGIAGENAGTIVACENRAFINTESIDPSLRLDSVDTSSILNFIRSFRTDNAGITSDIGGIAGSSSGYVDRCANSGAVGYLHLGYNVGGIVGRSSGYIKECVNDAEVYGRKDVGGIVGQAEPLVSTIQAENMLAGLSYRIYLLNQSVRDALEDARYASDVLSGDFDNISYYLSQISEAMRSLDPADPESFFYLQNIIADNADNITNEIHALSDNTHGNADVLLFDLNVINENLGALSETAIQTANKLLGFDRTDAEILADDSEAVDESQVTLGKTADSENNGVIYGDSNVGGIAGNVSIESEFDPESELNIGGNGLVKDKISLSVVITGCASRGEVTAKRECAGGIVGKMDLGLCSNCAAYGRIALEDGEYAGGTVGLLYGTVKNCFSKCSLSGRRFIGGSVGNGYAARGADDRSSLVSGCYTLVEILDEPQFAGAISGGGDGVYENNFFVPAGYAGLDRISIHGKAEPISFEDYAAVETLPEACRSFTLRFVADGAVIKEIPFEYGASFDRSVFPHIERRDGSYAVWDRTELHDLRFDTTVSAEYRMEETVLRSPLLRDDGRAAVYVDGRFQQGDGVELEQIPVGEEDIRLFSESWQETVREQLRSIFRDRAPDYSIPVSVREHLRVSFPDDGLETHSLRYLPPDGQTGNYRLYLAGEAGWERIRPQIFGSYCLFDVPGGEAELMLVSTIQSWWIAAYIAAALAILALLIVSIVKLCRVLRARPKKEKPARKDRPFPRFLRAHRKPILILTPLVLLAAAAAVLALRFGSVGSAFSTYRMLKNFSTRETDVLTEISIRTEDRDVEMSTTVHRVLHDGHMIRCTEQYGIPLYISDGMVCLENGRVFRLAEGQLSQGKVLDLALDVFLHEDIEKTVGDGVTCYRAVIGGETADRILQLFLSASGEELLRAEDMTILLKSVGPELQSLSFSGSGVLSGGTDFCFEVTLTPQEMTSRPAIPQAVLDAVASGGGEDAQVLSEEFLRLLAAWVKAESAETVSAEIDVNADCGALKLTPHYRYSRRTVDGTDVRCIRSALFKLYFTDDAACTADGKELSEAQRRVMDAARLIPIARELCLKGQFSFAGTAEHSIYTITLSGSDAEDIVARILPELGRLSISYDDCRLRITAEDGALASIELDCGGKLRIVARDVNASVLVTVRFTDSSAEAVPPRVRSVLVK